MGKTTYRNGISKKQLHESLYRIYDTIYDNEVNLDV